MLSTKLRSVIAELTRVADLLDGTTKDTITFFDETKKKEETDYKEKWKYDILYSGNETKFQMKKALYPIFSR